MFLEVANGWQNLNVLADNGRNSPRQHEIAR
jgi:hypothetical protein